MPRTLTLLLLVFALSGCARLFPRSVPDAAPGDHGAVDLRAELQAAPGDRAASDSSSERGRVGEPGRPDGAGDQGRLDLAHDTAKPKDQQLLVDQPKPKDQQLIVDQPKPKPDQLAADQGAMVPSCPASAVLSGWRPQLAWNGSQFGVLHHRTSGGVTQTHLGLLDANLTPVGTDTDIQDDGSSNSQEGQLVAGPAGAFGAVWTNATPPMTLVFQRIAGGTPLGANLILSGYWPAVAYNGSALEYMVFEADSTTRVSAAAGAQPSVPMASGSAPAAIWNAKGGHYALVRIDASATKVSFTQVTAAGVTSAGIAPVYTAPAGFVVDANSGNAPVSLARNELDDEYGVAFRLKPSVGTSLYAATLIFVQVSASGTPLKTVNFQPQGEYGLLEPAIAWGGGRYAAAWTDRDLKAVRLVALDRAGSPLTPVLTASCPATYDHRYPTLAWSPGRFGLAWNQGGEPIHVSWFKP